MESLDPLKKSLTKFPMELWMHSPKNSRMIFLLGGFPEESFGQFSMGFLEKFGTILWWNSSTTLWWYLWIPGEIYQGLKNSPRNSKRNSQLIPTETWMQFLGEFLKKSWGKYLTNPLTDSLMICEEIHRRISEKKITIVGGIPAESLLRKSPKNLKSDFQMKPLRKFSKNSWKNPGRYL